MERVYHVKRLTPRVTVLTDAFFPENFWLARWVPRRYLVAFRSERNPTSVILIWRVANHRCFKIADHPGYFK